MIVFYRGVLASLLPAEVVNLLLPDRVDVTHSIYLVRNYCTVCINEQALHLAFENHNRFP